MRDPRNPLVAEELATRDPTTIEQWWTAYPYADVAILTGGMSGIAVISATNAGLEILTAEFDLDLDRAMRIVRREPPTDSTDEGFDVNFVFKARMPKVESFGFGEGLDLSNGDAFIVNNEEWRADSDQRKILDLPRACIKKLFQLAEEEGALLPGDPSSDDPASHNNKGDAGETRVSDQNERSTLGRPRFSQTADIYDIQSIWSHDFVGLNWVVKSLLLDYGVSGLTGPSGAGKSSFALALADHIVRGKPFLGLEVQQRPVLILDKQNPRGAVEDRLTRLGIEPHRDLIFLGGWGDDDVPDIGSDILLRAVKRTPGLVIIADSFQDFHDGDENSNRDIGLPMRASRRLANAGASVLWIHHPGRKPSPKDWFRGGQIFKDQLDCGAFLTNKPPAHEKKDVFGDLTLTYTKSRAGGGHSPLTFRFKQSGPSGQFVLSGDLAVLETGIEDRVAILIRQHGPFNGTAFDDLMKTEKLPRKPSRAALERLMEVGNVIGTPYPPRGIRYQWVSDE
jgi:hypothetical protein